MEKKVEMYEKEEGAASLFVFINGGALRERTVERRENRLRDEV